MRLRIWYCLRCLEINLCLITGRPCAIQDIYCSAPCPTALDNEILPSGYEDSSTLDAYFLNHQRLMVVSTRVLKVLYSARNPKDKSWSEIQDSIRNLSEVLDIWRASLPFALDFSDIHQDRVFRRQVSAAAWFWINMAANSLIRALTTEAEPRVPVLQHSNADKSPLSLFNGWSSPG